MARAARLNSSGKCAGSPRGGPGSGGRARAARPPGRSALALGRDAARVVVEGSPSDRARRSQAAPVGRRRRWVSMRLGAPLVGGTDHFGCRPERSGRPPGWRPPADRAGGEPPLAIGGPSHHPRTAPGQRWVPVHRLPATPVGLLGPRERGVAYAVRRRAARVTRMAARCACRCSGPVSYTHLRAHETRHDLVCRLLLEKKKKKQNSKKKKKKTKKEKNKKKKTRKNK